MISNLSCIGELKLTTKKGLEREKDGLHAVDGGPFVLHVR